MNDEIRTGLSQRGIVKAKGWKYHEGLERKGYQKIEAHRDRPAMEGGRKVIYSEIFTLDVVNGVPQWETSGTTSQTMILPTPFGMAL